MDPTRFDRLNDDGLFAVDGRAGGGTAHRAWGAWMRPSDLGRPTRADHAALRLIWHLLHNKLVIGAIGALALVGIIAVAAYVGDKYALDHMHFEQVSVADLANAMQRDEYASDYREQTVIVQATIAAIDPATRSVQFATGVPYSVTCQLPTVASLKVGQTVRIAAEAYTGQRQPHGVLIAQCYRL